MVVGDNIESFFHVISAGYISVIIKAAFFEPRVIAVHFFDYGNNTVCAGGSSVSGNCF